VYIHHITDNRFGRGSVKSFEIFKKVVGPDALKNVLLVTSRWEGVSPTTGSDRERQLREKFWAYMLGRGCNMSRFLGDRDSAIASAFSIMLSMFGIPRGFTDILGQWFQEAGVSFDSSLLDQLLAL
jgi:hypothetical protein